MEYFTAFLKAFCAHTVLYVQCQWHSAVVFCRFSSSHSWNLSSYVMFWTLLTLLSYLQHIFFFRDLGVHIDGFIAVVGHTIVVGASKVCMARMLLLWLCSKK